MARLVNDGAPEVNRRDRSASSLRHSSSIIDTLIERAQAVAGDRDVDIAGGASTVRQAFGAGVIDELMLDIASVLLGTGAHLFDGPQDPGLEPVEVIHSPPATQVRYRIGR